MGRKQFTFYESFAVAVSRIKSKTARCEAYDAIVNYAIHGIEPDMNLLPESAAIAFDLIRPVLDKSAKRAVSGAAGGSKQTPSKTEANAKQTAREKEGEKEREGEIEIENECYTRTPARRFAPPTLDQVSAYCLERGNNVDPERFIDFYTSNGWKVGKNPMKDWKAAVRTWEREDRPQKKQTMTTFYDVGEKMIKEGLL
ncbi:MAG: hypothetical protein J6S60_07165 [Oscillospiraceae bacterium]|nr:hypothetical protein [Oscillospiraceae bacterium]